MDKVARACIYIFVVLCLIAFTTSASGAIPGHEDGPGTVQYAVAQPDGVHVVLAMVIIGELNSTGVSVHEWWDKTSTVAVLFRPPTGLKPGQTIEVDGRAITLPTGSRAILCDRIAYYLDGNGSVIDSVPPIKGTLDPSVWPSRTWMAVSPAPSGPQSLSLDDTVTVLDDPGPPTTSDPPPGPALSAPGGSIAEAKSLADASSVSLAGKIVTVGSNQFSDCIYIEEPNRSCGIRVATSGGTLVAGDRVDVSSGTISTPGAGERVIVGATVTKTDHPGEIEPAWLVNRDIGGTALTDGQTVFQQGVRGGAGLNNIGLLVKTAGRLTYNGGSFVYVDDGSALDDGSGLTGIRVETDHLDSANPVTLPSETGQTVAIRGISSCMIINNEVVRVLRPRAQDDIAIPSTPANNPQIPQGGSETFSADIPGDAPQGSLDWEIIRDGDQVATGTQPEEWLVVLSSAGTFTVGAPEDAEVAVNYQVRYIDGSTIASGYFDVIPASDNPKVPQGGTAIFASSGQEAPGQDLTWDIIREEDVIATDTDPNGWEVACDEDDQFTVSAPFSAQVAQGYQVRYRRTEETVSSPLDVTPNNAGTPAPDIPAPAWAAGVVPMDSCPAGGLGPSSADSVNLASGVGENRPDPDLVVNNPTGPDAVFSRLYRSALAEAGYASPGLSAGWTHNYDVTISSSDPGDWASVQLRYPNGATEILTPGLNGGIPTGQFSVPSGAPYVASGVSLSGGLWESIELEYPDHTCWTFEPSSSDPNEYLFSGISILAGNPIHMIYDSTGRIQSVVDGTTPNPDALLSFGYDTNGRLSDITDTYGRTVSFDFSWTAQATCLTGVSQIDSASARWTYGYTAINGYPYLTSVGAPDPRNGSATLKKSINYDSNGHVSALVDANGNKRQFLYNQDKTLVKSIDKSGRNDMTWVQKNSGLNVDSGTVDAKNQSDRNTYTGYMPTSIVNKSNQAVNVAYKPGYPSLVETVTDRLGIVTTYRYEDPGFPSLVTSVQEGSKTSTLFDYDGLGRIETVSSPKPGARGTGQRVTTTYTYTVLGNIETVTSPAPADTGVVTTKYFYTEDEEYSFMAEEALGQPLVVKVCEGLPAEDKVLYEIHYRYDERGNTTAVIDAYGHQTDLHYNIADQLTSTEYPGTGDTGTGRAREEYDYLYPGGPLSAIRYYDEGNGVVRTVNVGNGREGEMSAQSGGVQEADYAYDSEYRITSARDGMDNPVGYDYDSVGNLETLRYLLGDTIAWEYDADGNVVRRTDGNNAVTQYVRHSSDSSLVTTILYPGGSSNAVGFDYDSYGRIEAMWDNNLGYVEYDYDDNDALLDSTTSYNGWSAYSISYAYYPDGRRKQMVVPTALASMDFTYTYRYDNTNGPGSVIQIQNSWQPAAPIIGYVNQNGQLVRQTSSLTNTQYAFNPRGFLSDLRNTSPAGWSSAVSEFTGMRYDALGNRTAMTINIPPAGYCPDASGTISYEYLDGNARRLTRETSVRSNWYEYDGTYDHTFAPDNADNLTTIWGVGQAYDAENRMVGFQYDGNGNMTIGPNGDFTIGYDYENRPTSYNGVYSLESKFWPSGQRGWKNAEDFGNRCFLYDGDSLVCEMDDYGPRYIYVHGPAGLLQRWDLYLEPIYGSEWVTRREYTFDPQGTVVQRLDTDYQSVDTLVYDAYGAFKNTYTNPNRNDSVGFLGQWGAYTDWEIDAGSNGYPGEPGRLVLAGVRYYNPKMARFTSRDPSADGMNWYTYAENNPIANVDRTGRYVETALDVAGTAYDIYEFKKRPTIGNALWIAADVAGLALPLVPSAGAVRGGVKLAARAGAKAVSHADDAGRAARAGTRAAKAAADVIETHHLLPKEFARRFAKAGLEIEDYTLKIRRDAHRLKPDGLHTGAGNWNKMWKQFFDKFDEAGKTPKKADILNQLEYMKKQFGLK